MAKIPYMPLYIGDWLQDMDSVSLECEAAWLRVVFKMFKDNKSGVYKNNAKGLQRLWKCDANTMQNILAELRLEGIGIVEEENSLYVFKNRRMVKDQEVSKKRSHAANQRWNKDETECKPYTKDMQSPENEYENEYESDIDLLKKEQSINLKGVRVQDDQDWLSIWNLEEWRKKSMSLHSISETQLEIHFKKFRLVKQASASVVDRLPKNEILAHFNNWIPKQTEKKPTKGAFHKN